jgi:hypothetical protein
MTKDIRNKNNKGQSHGYQEWYGDNKLVLRGNFKNGNRIGYEELHHSKQIRFFIK